MKRYLNRLVLPAVLLALWLLLNDTLSPGQIALGATLALLLGWAAKRLRPLQAYPKKPLTAIRLIGHVAKDIVRSNLAVAVIICKGNKVDDYSGFLKIPLRMRDPHGLAALACIVTYTPGTVWSDYSERDGILTLHVLDLKDEEEWRRIIQHRYEGPLMEIFE
ncbi:Na+/H+ antiporter subunit E [Pollutimonas nitritireducens]|uniref:Na+/H+ antiporter subunit E n=1 Tax=Pollutimonas nitritireducens TaxID=2045209 RepID=A0A2N4UF45_9BURK|nr:Na+/H+ antiporter subunit E [Pollutimonas nitritireducens]PLC53648.1 Na+/H+ antiporter subunit E [Pollutimonas nitritireducens]